MTKHLDWIREKFKGLKVALKLQAKEYERRLTALNGEADRLHKMQEQYIPREVFDRTVESMNQKFDRVVDELKEKIDVLTLWKTKQEGKSQLIQYIPWILTAISIIILYTKK